MKNPCPLLPIKRERRKEARPGEIVAAALHVFVAQGFNAARMEDVAKQAGVAKGTVFRYFPTKGDLFKAVVEANVSDQFTTWRSRIAAFEGSSAELIGLAMLEWWNHTGSTPAAGISRIFLQEAKNFPDLAEYYHQTVIQPGRDILQSIFERGVRRGEFRQADTNAAKALMMAPMLLMAMGQLETQHRHSLLAADQTPEQFIKQLADIVVNGLKQTPGVPS